MSGPARDLWIEIKPGRARRRLEWSGPARDLWIEIVPASQCGTPRRCRVPQGTCGLNSEISDRPAGVRPRVRRVPQGTCGLKFAQIVSGSDRRKVGSRKGPVD